MPLGASEGSNKGQQTSQPSGLEQDWGAALGVFSGGVALTLGFLIPAALVFKKDVAKQVSERNVLGPSSSCGSKAG